MTWKSEGKETGGRREEERRGKNGEQESGGRSEEGRRGEGEGEESEGQSANSGGRITERKEESDIVAFVRDRLGMEPDEKQILVLRSEAKRGILNCSRQWGKSTIAAAKAIHRAYTQEKKLVLVASPGKRQSAEFLRKASDMVWQLGITPRGDGDNECSLLFPNGSRIVGLPGNEGRVRGFSAVSMLLIDEAARVDDAMYRALRPMLAVSNGELWLMSTPCGKRGFFYEAWAHGGERWDRVSAAATECSRISPGYLEEERGAMGAMAFRQEFLCEFVDIGGSVFGREMVEEALDEKVEGLGLTWE